MFRILAFIEHDFFVRNFVTSGAFDLLIGYKDFGFCVSEITSKLRSSIPAEKLVGMYKRSSRNMDLVFHFFQISMRALRSKSTTFDIKAKANWPGHQRLIVYGVYNLLSLPIFFRLGKKVLLKLFENNYDVEKIVQEYKPDLVIFPFTGVEGTGVELVSLSRKYGFKTFFLVNGWDNLSSKGILPYLPDYLGVWGPQPLVDAVNIQGMPAHRVFMLGCARYEHYLKRDNAELRLFPHNYILFAGAATASDEVTPLRILESVLEELSLHDVKIVYRPHPGRDEKHRGFEIFEPEKYRHVILDPQIADYYLATTQRNSESLSGQCLPELKYYSSLVNNAIFIISPMSSMILEAALFDVPALVLAHDDGCSLIPPHLQAKFRHFDGADEVPGWFFVRKLDELKQSFKMLLERFKTETPLNREFRPVLSSAVKRYLFHDGRSYAQRLEEAARVILAMTNKRDF